MRPAVVTEPRVEQVSAESDTELSTRTQQMRYLVRELGVSRAEAHALIRAFVRDMERPLVTSAASYSRDFLSWLMRQAPGGRRVAIRKHEWRVSS